jgi:pimeloyl-ACP methyl ester carboxylesterase
MRSPDVMGHRTVEAAERITREGDRVADAEELVGWLRRELGKERVFVLGHSWGSLVGLTLAARSGSRTPRTK